MSVATDARGAGLNLVNDGGLRGTVVTKLTSTELGTPATVSKPTLRPRDLYFTSTVESKPPVFQVAWHAILSLHISVALTSLVLLSARRCMPTLANCWYHSSHPDDVCARIWPSVQDHE